MPIRPEHRIHYGAAWRETRKTILARAGHCCEWCGRPNRQTVRVLDCGCWIRFTRTGREFGRVMTPYVAVWCGVPDHLGNHASDGRAVRTILTIAHLNHTPGDDRHENLAALCQRCHLRYDRAHHAETRGKRRGAQK